MKQINFLCRRAGSIMLAGTMAAAIAGCETVGLPGTPNVTNAAAPGFEKVTVGSEEAFIIDVGRRIYFSQGSASLDETARRTLDAQAAWLNKNRRWLVKLQGHADDPGSEEYNRTLSQQRADAVMAYLASKGVDRNRMWAKGYAKERIVRDCPEIECKAQNRRVVANLRTEKDDAASVDD